MLLDIVNEPSDLKKLSLEQLNDLSKEIRELLIKKASIIGGHLASNLGVVELTIALHTVFDSPIDNILFDVSHQCYTHKILTGRKDGFIKENEFKSVTGYTNPNESKHDLFKIGHTSTSISLASGIAYARDLNGDNNYVVSVIGDGSLSGGEAFEGLDYAVNAIKGKFIIVVNDNQMSIAENHGGIYDNLKKLRDSNGKCECNYFKSMGYEYLYVSNGHDISALIEAFNNAKKYNRPVVVHVCTVKGKGYLFAEMNKEKSHWVRPFDIDTFNEKNVYVGERYDLIVRDYLIKKMKEDAKVITMIAAVPDALSFGKDYREMVGNQFVDVGICEEHAISMAAGLAKMGFKPVFTTMSTFFQRTYDQISQELCINKMPVTMIVINASVYAPNDITHIGIFDVSMMSNIPNLVVLAPTNKQEYLSMIEWSINQSEWPVAIRAPRNGVYYSKYDVEDDYSNLNKYKIIQDGNTIAVIAYGDFFQIGEQLCNEIKDKYNIICTLINPRFMSGIDEKMLTSLEKKHKLIITLEDCLLDGGPGQKISSFLSRKSIKVLNYGLRKEFLDRYDVNQILQKNGITISNIINDINNNLEE